jgi:thiaminase/transcriptional activator TenA
VSAYRPSVEFRKKSESLWAAIHEHPFVRGIGVGDLPRDRFEHYLRQDYVYLIEFSRVLAVASAKSDGLSEMGYFAKLLHATLEFEMALHRRTCADFGIGADELERVEPSLITTAYTNFLVRTCYEGRSADILAALLPCEMGYVEVAERLVKKGLPADRHYKDWIETYSSAEFREFAEWVAAKLDESAAGSPRRALERLYRLYETSARFELLFFDMGWKCETWPVVPPV